MKYERAWKATGTGDLEDWKEISENRANQELANAHGDKAATAMKPGDTLATRFAHYRCSNDDE